MTAGEVQVIGADDMHVGVGVAADGADPNPKAPMIDVVIPVHNEETDLEPAVRRLARYLETMPLTWRITIADNASTDGTAIIAQRLAHRYDGVRAVHLPLKGRGRALKHVWMQSEAPVVAYMDVDLSTDLNALPPLVAPLLSGHSDIAVGTRLNHGSRVERGAKRELISRCYNLLLRGTLRARFSDAQCGFKAIRRDVALQLLPLVEDDSWFFDTELLVLAERANLRIHEVAVDWIDDPDSRVDLTKTITDDLRGIARLSWSLMRGRVPLSDVQHALGRTAASGARGSLGAQSAIFALIGVASTIAYAVLYLFFRELMSAQTANALALVTTAIANTAANRRHTFGVTGSAGRMRHQVQGLIVFGVGLAATSGVLWLFDKTVDGSHPIWEILELTATNLAVTVLRFIAMRTWIFAPRGAPQDPRVPAL